MPNRMIVHSDCLYFKGHIPCTPHKERGVHCDGCPEYNQIAGRILVIKLGAAGDVIRTTSILSPLRDKYPQHQIWWLSDSPELVPRSVHRRLLSTPESYLSIQATPFDVVINLDKDHHACALASTLTTNHLYGFTLKDGAAAPANELADHKFNTGLFDDLSKSNTKSYPQEMAELCDLPYNINEYEMDAPTNAPLNLPVGGSHVVGLNTGCGDRWRTREWPLDSWASLITLLHAEGYTVVLLGGPAEHDRNMELHAATNAHYEGTFPLGDFPGVVQQCDVIVTAVTMAMHIAIGLKKRLVLMNNIFNPHEFELYGRGVLIEPSKPCTCYFQQTCSNGDYECMDHLDPQTLLDAVRNEVKQLG